jgi:hypothetical protein
MSEVSVDLWMLIARNLNLLDLKAFFLISKKASKVTEREDFWIIVCRRNYGDWNLGDFDQKTWKGMVQWITKRRNFLKSIELPYECYDSISFAIEEQFDRFYIRSPDRATFYYENSFPKGARNGDVRIETESLKLAFWFKYEDLENDVPSVENCWPYKSIEYSQIDEYVYVGMTQDQFLEMHCTLVENTMVIKCEKSSQQTLFIPDHDFVSFCRNIVMTKIHRFHLDGTEGNQFHLRY